MYQKFRDDIEQIKSSWITLHIRLKFRDYIEQIKSLGIKIYIGPEFMDYLFHFPYSNLMETCFFLVISWLNYIIGICAYA